MFLVFFTLWFQISRPGKKKHIRNSFIHSLSPMLFFTFFYFIVDLLSGHFITVHKVILTTMHNTFNNTGNYWLTFKIIKAFYKTRTSIYLRILLKPFFFFLKVSLYCVKWTKKYKIRILIRFELLLWEKL